MRLHQRETVVNSAELEIRLAVLQILDTADLTPWETARVLNGAFGHLLGGVAKYEIRFERHGNYEQEGGLE